MKLSANVQDSIKADPRRQKINNNCNVAKSELSASAAANKRQASKRRENHRTTWQRGRDVRRTACNEIKNKGQTRGLQKQHAQKHWDPPSQAVSRVALSNQPTPAEKNPGSPLFNSGSAITALATTAPSTCQGSGSRTPPASCSQVHENPTKRADVSDTQDLLPRKGRGR